MLGRAKKLTSSRTKLYTSFACISRLRDCEALALRQSHRETVWLRRHASDGRRAQTTTQALLGICRSTAAPALLQVARVRYGAVCKNLLYKRPGHLPTLRQPLLTEGYSLSLCSTGLRWEFLLWGQLHSAGQSILLASFLNLNEMGAIAGGFILALRRNF